MLQGQFFWHLGGHSSESGFRDVLPDGAALVVSILVNSLLEKWGEMAVGEHWTGSQAWVPVTNQHRMA